MNKILTTNGASHKKIIAAAISMLIIIIWIIFSAIYIIQDKWQDFQLAKMRQVYQNGITDSIRSLMTESAKCNKIPLYYGDQIIEVVAVSCLSASKEDKPQASANKESAKTEKPSAPAAEQPMVEKPEAPAAEQPMVEKPEAPAAEQPME